MKKLFAATLVLCALLACHREPAGPFQVADLLVDYQVTPLGIDAPSPSFSWKMVSDRYDQHQVAYRVVVTEAGKDTPVWDSDADGTLPSDVSVGVVYRGEPLKPCTARGMVRISPEAPSTRRGSR